MYISAPVLLSIGMQKIFRAKKGWLVFGGLLSFCLVQARGQTSNGTQIIGYLDSSFVNDMSNLSNSPYTTFIDGFILPAASSTVASPLLQFDTMGSNFNPNNQSELSAAFVSGINSVESAGKNVLLSFGGSTVSAADYGKFAASPQATAELASLLTAYVTGGSSYMDATGATRSINTYAGSTRFGGFNGIDIDFEDSQSFLTNGSYNGVTFLSNLTLDLSNDFKAATQSTGKNYILTHAPQTPYLLTNYANAPGMNGAYKAVLTLGTGASQSLTAAGKATTWLNVQFYNNPSFDGNNSVSGVVAAFENLVQDNPGIPTGKLVLTLPSFPGAANDNNNFTPAEIQQIIKQINAYLNQQGDGSIAGVAGFQLSNPNYPSDMDSTPTALDAYNTAFAANIAQVVVPEPSSWVLPALGILGLLWKLVRSRWLAGQPFASVLAR